MNVSMYAHICQCVYKSYLVAQNPYQHFNSKGNFVNIIIIMPKTPTHAYIRTWSINVIVETKSTCMFYLPLPIYYHTPHRSVETPMEKNFCWLANNDLAYFVSSTIGSGFLRVTKWRVVEETLDLHVTLR